MRRRKTVFVDSDILVIGGGMSGCGATYESRYWGRDLKIVCVEKANIERSGAVAQGLYAINCYMGMQWNENQPEDHVRYARNDLMGLVREDLGYDIARHVDSTVHKFEEWGLPIMRDPETGKYLREGKWQIMIHGESYKPIVAEAARKAATEVYNRIMVTHLLMDKTKPNRVAGAVGFNVRNGNFYVFRAKAVIVAAGGASHIFKPRAVGEGMGRTWYAPWSSASAYALPIQVGAKMTQMENRIVLTRFKDGYGPVGAYFLHLKTYTQNAYGQDYEAFWRDSIEQMVGDYVNHHPVPTCLRNHALLEEVKAGRGPIRMAKHRSQGNEPRVDHIRALRHGLPRDVFRRLGKRSGGLRTRGIPVGIQSDDDHRRTLWRRRHHRRHRPQVFVGILHGRPDRRQGCGQIRQ
jgi:adenylylsulfate reductase subunit A